MPGQDFDHVRYEAVHELSGFRCVSILHLHWLIFRFGAGSRLVAVVHRVESHTAEIRWALPVVVDAVSIIDNARMNASSKYRGV